jgi:non-homologous end joining protein Ku
VINLMDALRASIKGEVKKPAAASTGARRPAKRKSAR